MIGFASSALFVLISMLAGVALVVPPRAQSGWVRRDVPPPGTPRSYAMVYDSARDRVVLTTGAATWEWDGSYWTRVAASRSPGERNAFAMAYDAVRQVCVLFGGWANGDRGDTWEWDGRQWRQRLASRSPSPRTWHALAYDSARRRVVLFGGFSARAGYHDDLWEWDGGSWTEIRVAGRPPQRAHHALAYDDSRRRLVVFGGHRNGPRFDDTWEWDGAMWRRHAVSSAVRPPRRAHAGMAYDATRRAVVLFGGWDGRYMADTWEWNGIRWRSMPSRAVPAPRSAPLVFQSVRSRLLLFGGTGNTGPLTDTWEGAFAVPEFRTFGRGCRGTRGVPVLRSVPGQEPRLGEPFGLELSNLPPLQAAFFQIGVSRTVWGRLRLPFSLAVIGMPGCTAYVSGEHVASTINRSGRVRWQSRVPATADLLGAFVYAQGVVTDGRANAAGAVTSAGGAARVGL